MSLVVRPKPAARLIGRVDSPEQDIAMYTNQEEKTGSFTFAAEGTSDPTSKFFYGKLSHPSEESGVTIGAGYDMGGRSETQVKTDLVAAGANADVATKMAKGAGLTGSKAEEFVKTNRSTLVINEIHVLQKLFANIYPGYVTRAKQCFAYHSKTFKTAMSTYGSQYTSAVFFDWEYLYPAIRVIAIDFVYQGFGKQQAGYGKPLHFCMTNDFDWLIRYIQSSPLNQYEAGRRRAQYLRGKKAFETAAYSNCLFK